MSLAAYAELQRILSRSLDFLYSGTDTPSGLQVNCDYMLIIKTFETQIMAWKQQWVDHRNWEAPSGDMAPTLRYKKLISEFYFNYAMLVLNSFGLQNALERAPVDIGHFFARVHTSAHACAVLVRDELGPSGFMRFSPDSHFVQTSYAVLSLLKLVRPEFQAFLDNEQSTLGLVRDVADTLDNIAANRLHTPALYSGFLRALIAAKIEPHGADGMQQLQQQQQQQQQQHGVVGGALDGSQDQALGAYAYAHDPAFLLNEFQFDSEMGPAADLSTFPPTMAPAPPAPPPNALTGGDSLAMEHILGTGFWESMLVPGYGSADGLSGGFVFGAGGSGLITPRFGMSPAASGVNTPRGGGGAAGAGGLTQMSINHAFGGEGVKIDS